MTIKKSKTSNIKTKTRRQSNSKNKTRLIVIKLNKLK